MDKKFIKAQEILKKYNQEHLLKFYDNLEEKNKEKLLNQILETDFELLKDLYNNINVRKKIKDEIAPIEYINKEKISDKEKEEYKETAKMMLKNNKYAVVTMAGGQGTRLRTQWTQGYFYVSSKSSKIIVRNFL